MIESCSSPSGVHCHCPPNVEGGKVWQSLAHLLYNQRNTKKNSHLPLAEYLRRDTDPQQPSNSTVLQLWYADNMAMMGAGKRIARVFKLLMEKGPSVVYFPEPAKSYHICPKE